MIECFVCKHAQLGADIREDGQLTMDLEKVGWGIGYEVSLGEG